MDKTFGFLAPVVIAAFIFILNTLLPGRWVKGYVTRLNSNDKLRYHLNGLQVFFTVILVWFLLGYFNVVPFEWLYIYRWYCLSGACLSGIIFSLAVVMQYPPVSNSFVSDLFFGRIENLQFRGGLADAKMWLYLTGATMLELNALSFTAHHLMRYGNQTSAGIILSTTLLTYFLIDYLIFEEVQLYTYDLFA